MCHQSVPRTRTPRPGEDGAPPPLPPSESQTKAVMFTLFHHPFCPHSRFVRLALGEYGLDLRLVEERAWERREAFLALNPTATPPVLVSVGQPPIPGPGTMPAYPDGTHRAG